MGRAPCCDKASVKRGPWSPEEDNKLKSYIEQYGNGGNWISLPQKIGLKRCGKSCRLRWLNYLRPNLKHGEFSEEEDNIICNLYISIGSRWSIIAAQLPGRTDNDIKNYWNTRLKKKLLGRHKQPPCNKGSDCNYTSNSALERLRLHLQQRSTDGPFALESGPPLWPMINTFEEKMMTESSDVNPIPLHGPPVSFVDHVGSHKPYENFPLNSLLSGKLCDGFTMLPHVGPTMAQGSSTMISGFGQQGEMVNYTDDSICCFGQHIDDSICCFGQHIDDSICCFGQHIDDSIWLSLSKFEATNVPSSYVDIIRS